MSMLPHVRRAVLLTTTVAAAGQAQSLIVGIPNAEATPKGAWFFTHESQIVPTEPRSWNTFQFLTWGAGHVGHGLIPGGVETELALSFVNFGRPATANRTIAAGFKSVYLFPTGTLHRWEARLTGGAMLPVSLDGRGAGTWLYSSASVRVPGLATRLTAGPTYGTPQLFGVEKLGAMAGIEQPLGGPFRRKVSLIADWYSGRHDLAALIPAVQFNLPRELILIAGYKLPNPGAPGGRALVVEVAGILARPRREAPRDATHDAADLTLSPIVRRDLGQGVNLSMLVDLPVNGGGAERLGRVFKTGVAQVF